MQLILKDVTKVYSVDNKILKAVDNVSLEIRKGEFISIVGHSGSGKTTLLSIIGGIIKPLSGSVLFNGTDVYSLNSDKISEYRCEKIGFMFQFASLLPVLTSKENVLLPMIFTNNQRHSSSENDEQKAVELLKMVGLGDKINAYPSQLSGGQQRRVAIARAFINDPELILADEPTGDLDVDTEADMIKFFQKMNEEKGATFIIVTHSTDLAQIARQKLRMSNGSLSEA